MDPHRNLRVSDAVREELTELVEYELDDPRLADVRVTHVEVSPDMRHAAVKIEGENKTLAALEHAQPYLRHELATRLNLRRVPELHFSVDAHPDADTRVEILLRRAKKASRPIPDSQ